MIIAPSITVPEAEIATICRRYQVKEVSVFGSAARGELGPDSDVGLLVDFLPGASVGLLELATIMRELSRAVGRPVDLTVKPSMKPLIRQTVLAEAHILYAA